MLKHFRVYILIFAAFLFVNACSPSKSVSHTPKPSPVITAAIPADSTKSGSLLQHILTENAQLFEPVISHRNEWNVQVIYTRVDRGANGIPALRTEYYNVNPARYFYPASTVKLPICLLALQRLNELKDKGIDKNTTMITEAAGGKQTAVYNDPTSPDGRPTIAQYIKKILMVSDNDAFNRLYEFLGQEYINSELHRKGYEDAQILHRLQIALSEAENRRTNPVNFIGSNNVVLYAQPQQENTAVYTKRSDSLGKGYLAAGNLIDGQMDFSKKNRISLEDLHTILISLVFPNKVKSNQRFNITDEDRNFMLKYMSQLPTESTYPPYSSDTLNYWPAYCKFLLLGQERGEVPNNIRIFNKPGDAYGHMLDVAYIVDFDKNVEFFLSAVIYCNSDGILNDDKYDYNSIGFPFMKNLGKAIYDYEINRNKKNIPDLSTLKFAYDKN